MTQVLPLTAVVVPALVVWSLLRRRVEPGRFAEVETAGIAIAFALGITSIVFFVWRLTGMPLRHYAAFDVGMQVAGIGAALYLARRRGRATEREPRGGGVNALEGVAALIAVMAIGTGAAMFWQSTASLPRGDWDGWAIWNLRAAFLVEPTEHWRAGFSPLIEWSHPDYPLLVPGSVARLWSFGEPGAVFGSRLFAAAVLLSSALVVAGSVGRQVGTVGASFALVLLLTPTYVFWAASQTADVPLGLFALIAVTSLASSPTASRYWLAGTAAGFAAWTKNEGLLLAVLLAIAATALARTRRDLRLLVYLGIGLAVGAATLVLFKTTVGPPSDLLQEIVTQQPLTKAAAAERHLQVAQYMARELFAWGGWSLLPASLMVCACLVTGALRWRRIPSRAAVGASIVAVMLAAYYWIYVLSPYDLEWHLRTSFARLVAQLWPLVVWFAVVVCSRACEPSSSPSSPPV